jgi:hypothetical protein
MANDNPDTTAFYRFADFENYYPRRMKTDEYLYNLFTSLDGKPKEKHPLSFVLQGSDFLDNWFGNGTINKIKLKNIPSRYVSFTLGDSMTVTKKDGLMVNEIQHGKLIMYTKEMLFDVLDRYNGTLDEFLNEIKEKHNYIEAQLWNDEYCTMSEHSIEYFINEKLTGDAQKNALELAAYLKANDISCMRETTGYWADKIYFICNYKAQSVCYITINESESNTWNIQGDDSGDDWFENVPLDARMKEIAWEHVSVCENENRCFDGCVRKRKVIFGKAFDSVCPITIKFDNPNAAEIECMKAIFKARKNYIQNSTV